MASRRSFLGAAAGLAAAAGAASAAPSALAQTGPAPLPANRGTADRFRPSGRVGMGGTQVGSNHFRTPAQQAAMTLQAAWDEGVGYYDTSPWYGLGLSERRFGTFFDDKPRAD